MAYALSFAPSFFQGPHQSNKPTTVEQALTRLSQETWDDLARTIFDCDPATLDIATVIRKIEETNTCLNLDSPVEVCIDPEGEFTVLVYDK